MENLNDLGIDLRQIKVSEWTSLVEDLNYNFSLLLSSPIFKGMPGDEGDPGVATSGERGSRWYWANWEDFKLAYGLTNQAQLNLNFINGQLASDLVKLLATLKTDSIISNDNIVLPSGMIITFDITLGKFKDSGTSFAQAQGVTEERVGQLITAAIAGINEGAIIYEVFKAYAKNFPDSSVSGINNQVNPDSTLDIGTPNSKPGYLMDRHKFIALATANMNTVQDSATFVFGAAELYHDLIQKTQNSVGRTTNEYTPGVNDSTVLGVLQDNYKNGIVIGYKAANTMREFSRIYRDETSLHMTSNYSVYENEYSEVVIREDVITLKTKDLTQTSLVDVKSNFRVIGKARFMNDILHTALEVLQDQNLINIGIAQSGMPVGQTYKIDFKESPTFSSIPSMTFLGTDINGKVKGSGYTVTQTLNSSSTPVQIPSATAVLTAINTLSGNINADIAALTAQINVLVNRANLTDRDAMLFTNTNTVPGDGSPHGVYRIDATNSPTGTAGFIINMLDTSNLTKSQIAITANGIMYRSAVGSINGTGWNRAATSAELNAIAGSVDQRLNAHTADISNLSTNVTNNYNTLNNKIDTNYNTLFNKINGDVGNAVATLRSETVSAIQGISVGLDIDKALIGNSIQLSHRSVGTTVSLDPAPATIITSLSINNGHVTNISYVPFSQTTELQFGMVIDLIAFYTSPQIPYWYMNPTYVSQSWDACYNQYFDVNGVGLPNAVLNDVNGGFFRNINISKFALCDGRNSTPNLTGVTLIGAGRYAPTDNNGFAPETLLSGIAPFVPNNINTNGAPPYDVPFYGLSKRAMTLNEMPSHSHDVNAGSVQAGGGNAFRGWNGQSGVGFTTNSRGGGAAAPMMQMSFATFKIMYRG